MKKSILILGLLLSAGTFTYAQTSDKHSLNEDRATKMTAQMQQRLGLSEEQSKKVYQINLDWANKMEVARTNKDRDANTKARSDRDEQLSKVLTPEQMHSYRTTQTTHMQPAANTNQQAK
jgi:hypothetical protein